LGEKIVKANGVDICTQEFGNPSDPTILLVMGATASMLRWPEAFCERLAEAGRHVIRYDNRDTGRSTTYDPGTVPYTVEDMADDAIGVLDAYGIDKAHIVGASMGGMITQQIALRHPDRVRTITPIMTSPGTSVVGAMFGEDAGALPGPDAKVIEAMAAGLGVDPTDEDAVIANAVAVNEVLAGSKHPFDLEEGRDFVVSEMKRANDYRASQNHILAITNTPPWRERLGEITVPTLVIHGTEDPILPFAHGEAVANEIPGAKLLAMDGVGHEIPEGEWDVIVPAILEHTA
jgi:pimeloyl-ACP methyl ester carboxylesterase